MRPSQAVVHVRPFKELAAEAKALGFGMLFAHEDGSFEVAIRLEPLGLKQREALRRSSEDPLADGIEVTTVFDKRRAKLAADGVYVPFDSAEERQKAIDVALQDTATTAIHMAKVALGLERDPGEEPTPLV